MQGLSEAQTALTELVESVIEDQIEGISEPAEDEEGTIAFQFQFDGTLMDATLTPDDRLNYQAADV